MKQVRVLDDWPPVIKANMPNVCLLMIFSDKPNGGEKP